VINLTTIVLTKEKFFVEYIILRFSSNRTGFVQFID